MPPQTPTSSVLQWHISNFMNYSGVPPITGIVMACIQQKPLKLFVPESSGPNGSSRHRKRLWVVINEVYEL